jgi:hypothetical protein
MLVIPENLTEFLFWVKERTEAFWSIDPKTSTNDFVCEEWIYGAKWIGLTDAEIDEVEAKYSIRFMPEHREFLRILHTIDRYEPMEDEDIEIAEDGTEFFVNKTHLIPYFYNWLKDDVEINRRFNWAFETIFEDVAGSNGVWLKSWGARPKTEDEKKEIFTNWYNKTPKILPLTSHRFLVSEPDLKFKPVLSIWGSDIIVYGWDLRSYLIDELQEDLNLFKLVFDEEDQCNYSESIDEVQAIFEKNYAYDAQKTIPYWEEMILFWTSGWSSFGLKYPGEENATIHPIMKTYTVDEEENSQKTFTGF